MDTIEKIAETKKLHTEAIKDMVSKKEKEIMKISREIIKKYLPSEFSSEKGTILIFSMMSLILNVCNSMTAEQENLEYKTMNSGTMDILRDFFNSEIDKLLKATLECISDHEDNPNNDIKSDSNSMELLYSLRVPN